MIKAKLTKAQSVYLDFLRAAAAMTVLCGHTAINFLQGNVLSRMDLQSGAVLVFFLLSGFLISYSTFLKMDSPKYDFREYFIDRFCRIYCAFLPALIFVWLVDMQTIRLPFDHISPDRLETLTWIKDLKGNFNLPTWFGNLFMLQDFPLFQVTRRIFHIDSIWLFDEFGSGSPFWTVAIEWWIYIAFGMIVLVVFRNKKVDLWQWPVMGFIMIVPAYYLIGGNDNCLSFLWLIGMGACLLFLYFPKNYFSNRTWKYIFVLVFLGSIFAMIGRLLSLKFDQGEVNFTELQFSVFLAIAVFSILFLLRYVESVPHFIERICRFMAGYSYSLYLTHAPIITYLYLKFPYNDNSPGFFWIAVLASNIVAIAFWWLFERHYHTVARILKQRFLAH